MNFVYKAPRGYSQTWLDIRIADCLQMDTIQEMKDMYLMMSEREIEKKRKKKKKKNPTTSRYLGIILGFSLHDYFLRLGENQKY